MKNKWLATAFIAGLCFSIGSASADYVIKDGNGVAQTVFAFVCQSVKICSAQVLVDSTGTEKATATNPLLVGGAQFSSFTANIANGQSLSGAVDLASNRLFALVIPSVWTGITTPITFQASADWITYGEMYDSTGTEVQIAVTGVSTYVLNAIPAEWLGVRFIKVRSGTAGSAVTQGQSTNIIIVAVP